MLRQKPERWIALAVIACTLALAAILTLIVGHWQFNPDRRTVHAYFQSCVGIDINSPIRYAGAPVGRVARIEVVPRAEQKQSDGKCYYVKVTLVINRSLEVGDDASFEIKQEGVLGAKFVGITPGKIDAPLLADDATVLGVSPVDLIDLAAPGKELLVKLGPVVDNLHGITQTLNQSVPGLITKVDDFLDHGDELLADVGSPENKRRLAQMLADLRVVSGNLKVVTTNAKAFTATIGERPWRLLFGGKPTTLPTEAEILASPKPVPIPANP